MKKLFLAVVFGLLAATGVQAQGKIAHVNSQKLLDTMPSRKKAIEEITYIQKQGYDELKEMDANIQKMYAEYMKNRGTMSPQIQEYEEGRIQKKQAELEAHQQDLEQRVEMLSQELNAKIIQSVKEAVEVVAKRKGIEYVIDETNTLYAKGPDLTNEVTVELLKIDAKKNPPTGTTTGGTAPAGGMTPPTPAGGK